MRVSTAARSGWVKVDALLEGAEIRVEIGLAGKILRRGVAALLQLRVDLEAVAGVIDRRAQHLRPAKIAEAALRLPHAFDRAGHAHGAIADQAHALDHLALIVEIHGFCRRERRPFAVIEEIGLAVHVERHETAAADIAGLGIGDGERERDRRGRVDSVAAFLEDLLGRVGAELVRDRDGRCSEHGRLRRRRSSSAKAGMASRAAEGHGSQKRQRQRHRGQSLFVERLHRFPPTQLVTSEPQRGFWRHRLQQRRLFAVRPYQNRRCRSFRDRSMDDILVGSFAPPEA